jgi:hypothetical protein
MEGITLKWLPTITPGFTELIPEKLLRGLHQLQQLLSEISIDPILILSHHPREELLSHPTNRYNKAIKSRSRMSTRTTLSFR